MARFSRGADLSTGIVLYPVQGITALLSRVVAAFIYYFGRIPQRNAAFPIYSAAVLASHRKIHWALMLTPRGALDDPDALRHIFDSEKWWLLKTALHVLTFLTNVWALAVLA